MIQLKNMWPLLWELWAATTSCNAYSTNPLVFWATAKRSPGTVTELLSWEQPVKLPMKTFQLAVVMWIGSQNTYLAMLHSYPNNFFLSSKSPTVNFSLYNQKNKKNAIRFTTKSYWVYLFIYLNGRHSQETSLWPNSPMQHFITYKSLILLGIYILREY